MLCELVLERCDAGRQLRCVACVSWPHQASRRRGDIGGERGVVLAELLLSGSGGAAGSAASLALQSLDFRAAPASSWRAGPRSSPDVRRIGAQTLDGGSSSSVDTRVAVGQLARQRRSEPAVPSAATQRIARALELADRSVLLRELLLELAALVRYERPDFASRLASRRRARPRAPCGEVSGCAAAAAAISVCSPVSSVRGAAEQRARRIETPLPRAVRAARRCRRCRDRPKIA